MCYKTKKQTNKYKLWKKEKEKRFRGENERMSERISNDFLT